VAPLLLSATAEQGLAISPVPISLTGLTSAQAEQIGEGSYLVNAIGDCNGCHAGPTGQFLAGGTAFGPVNARNLTPDPTTGLPADIQTVAQFTNVLQTGADYHGVAAGSSPTTTLIVMPWDRFRWLSTNDIQAIYAYLTVIPPVVNAVTATGVGGGPPGTPPTTFTDGNAATPPTLPPETDATGAPIPDPGNVLRGLAINPISSVVPPTDPGEQALFGRGAYLVTALADCTGCHTNPATTSAMSTVINTSEYLTGGQVFATPPPLQPVVHTVRAASANLEGKTNGFFNFPQVGFSVFLTDITEGVHAEDPHPEPLAFPMPWQTFRNMQLTDLQAIYEFLSQVGAQYGTTTLTGAADKVIPNPALYCDTMNACPPGSTCSSTTGAGECLSQTCTTATVLTDCAVCQTCSAATGGTCQAPAPAALATCMTNGY
jgi:hypothetical protein